MMPRVGPLGNVVAVVVTHSRPEQLQQLLSSLNEQTHRLAHIIVVDNGGLERTRSVTKLFPQCEVLTVKRNLGGAGGFAYGMLHALAFGADLIWLMDDDGRPENASTLEDLIDGMLACQWDAAAPLVIDSSDPARTAFPFRFGLKFFQDVRILRTRGPVKNFAHLFNGLLITAGATMRAGLPDARLFLRGDEVDFMHRLIAARIPFGTLTTVGFVHPSSSDDIVPVRRGWLHVIWPADDAKRQLFFRNRGYLIRRHRMWLLLVRDLVCYSYFFIVMRRADTRGLRRWLGTMLSGAMERF